MTLQDNGTIETNSGPSTLSALLIMLAKRYQNDDKDKLRVRFRDRICDDVDLCGALADFWFSLHYTHLLKPPKTAADRAKQASETKLKVENIASVIEDRFKLKISLEMMIGDKKLSEYAKEEVAKFGGWFSRIADKLKPGQTVGQALSEKQLQKLCDNG